VDLNPESLPKPLGCLKKKVITILDSSPHIIWKATVGKGDIGAFFKDGNVCGLIGSTRFGCGTGSACYPTDNHNFYMLQKSKELSFLQKD
jgi:hypothetical protein